MKRTLIRYKAKPELADRNAELVSAVFAELKAAGPDGVRYLTLRLEDDTFIHLVEAAAEDGSSPIPKLRAFQAFQDGIRDRCAEPPLVRDVRIVGNYRMLNESRPGEAEEQWRQSHWPPSISRRCWRRCGRSCIATARAWSARSSTVRMCCRMR